MTWKVLVVAGLVVIATWPVAHARHESYWWGLPAGLAILFAGVIASGGAQGGGE